MWQRRGDPPGRDVEDPYAEFGVRAADGETGAGRFGFIAVDGWMDCRETTRDGRACVEFTWEGSHEGDQVSGRGWATLTGDGALDGRILFHLGDDSAFHAVPAQPRRPPNIPDGGHGEHRGQIDSVSAAAP